MCKIAEMKKAQLKIKPTANAKREEIVRLAYDVFSAHGFHETGVDRLMSDSGISKRTLYKYFRSKEELIAAAMDYYRQKTMAGIMRELERRGAGPKEKLLALFDMKKRELSERDYCGCFALNARLVYDGDYPVIHSACSSFLENVQAYIADLCRDYGCARPAETSMQIMLLFTGTIIHGQARHDPAAALMAKEAVRTLLDNVKKTTGRKSGV